MSGKGTSTSSGSCSSGSAQNGNTRLLAGSLAPSLWARTPLPVGPHKQALRSAHQSAHLAGVGPEERLGLRPLRRRAVQRGFGHGAWAGEEGDGAARQAQYARPVAGRGGAGRGGAGRGGAGRGGRSGALVMPGLALSRGCSATAKRGGRLSSASCAGAAMWQQQKPPRCEALVDSVGAPMIQSSSRSVKFSFWAHRREGPALRSMSLGWVSAVCAG